MIPLEAGSALNRGQPFGPRRLSSLIRHGIEDAVDSIARVWRKVKVPNHAEKVLEAVRQS